MFIKFILTFSVCASTMLAQSPTWYNNANKPSNSFVGMGSDKDRELAIAEAKQQIASQISSQVSSFFLSDIMSNTGNKNENRKKIISQKMSKSDIQLFGVTIDKIEKVNDVWFTKIFVVRDEMIQGYKQKVNASSIKINAMYPITASTFEDSIFQLEKVLGEITTGQYLLQTYEYLMLSNLGTDSLLSDWVGIESKINSQLSTLTEKKSAENNQQIVEYITDKLHKYKGWNVYVAPFTYKNWSVASPWGIELAELVAARYAEQKQAKLVTNPAKADLIISGTIIESRDGTADLSIRETLTDSDSTDVRGTVFKHLSRATCSSIGWERIRPANGKVVESAMAEYYRTLPPLDQNLSVELKTDKGDEAIVYRYGEHPQIYVKVSAPCYLKLFYTFATGETVLLLKENQWIDKESVGKWVRLNPTDTFFEVTEPAGGEFLTIQACSEILPVEFVKQVPYKDGYFINYVQDKSLVETRGMAVKNNISYSERRLPWTVVEK